MLLDSSRHHRNTDRPWQQRQAFPSDASCDLHELLLYRKPSLTHVQHMYSVFLAVFLAFCGFYFSVQFCIPQPVRVLQGHRPHSDPSKDPVKIVPHWLVVGHGRDTSEYAVEESVPRGWKGPKQWGSGTNEPLASIYRVSQLDPEY